MINVISSEFYKILRSRVFHIISGILLFLNVVTFGRSLYVKYSDSITAMERQQMTATGFMSYQSSFSGDILFYVILVFAAYLITSEYANKSIRQMACHGITRWKLVLGQYIAISLVATIMMLCFAVINLTTDTILNGLGTVDAAVFARMNVGIICIFWGVSALGVLLSYIFRNGVLTIIISLLLVMGSNIAASIMTEITKNQDFITYSLSHMRLVIVNFKSVPSEVMNYSVIFLGIAAVSIALASVIFTKRDIH